MKKKKILLHSNYCGAPTGFGGFANELLTYLYKTGKYELYHFASGLPWSNPEFARWPWKCYGTLPDDQNFLNHLAKEEGRFRMASYGELLIDQVIKEVRPDIYIGSEDPWGVDYSKDKPWWNKIHCIIHTTLDSRPILSSAIDLAKKTKHFFCWADFATKDMHKMGFNHVKTLRGSVNTNVYKKLSNFEKREIRKKFNIDQDTFCIGFLSRNQLRKNFPQLIEGFKIFQNENPNVKAKLLLFTCFQCPGEYWDIPRCIEKYNVKNEDVLAVYRCHETGEFFVSPFCGDFNYEARKGVKNPITGHDSLGTVSVRNSLRLEQINEWYNILDVYVHPFTSGGQERGIQEAKLCELITLVTNYSCGEDACVPEAHSLPLDFAFYPEQGTLFDKATTYPSSIAKQLKKVLNFDSKKKQEWGKKAREWTIKNYSIENIGKQFEDIIDSLEFTNYDFSFEEEEKNPEANIENIDDDKEFIKQLYSKILKMNVPDEDGGLLYWMGFLKNGRKRNDMVNYFRQEAAKHNAAKGQKNVTLESLLRGDARDRILINIPESIGDCILITSLLKDARRKYKEKFIYIATKPQYMEIFNPLVGLYIDGVVPWQEQFDNSMSLEGYGAKSLFHIVLQPHFPTQRMINYLHHGEDIDNFDLKFKE
ncbi:MAG: hypothetical protein HC836_24195 [Richelia sp. RM2_1_2]|nr:hypothetical protein [Richelia sp. RM2_1_2]